MGEMALGDRRFAVRDKRKMMLERVLQLYPLPSAERELRGLYLVHRLRARAEQGGQPFVYANFVTSIDGRIAVPRSSGEGLMAPKNIANARDWRLFQELAAQADVIISSGRYLRDWAEGRAQEILQVDDPQFADLRDWRVQNNLPPQPDIAIVSRSLHFSIPDVLKQGGRKVVFFTTANPNLERVREIENEAGRVIVAGKNRVEGDALVQEMQALGYRTIYSAAGPKILHMLLKANVLNRLYVTYANRLLGGAPFAALTEGALLEPPVGMKLHELYFDAAGLDGLGQLFVSYNCV